MIEIIKYPDNSSYAKVTKQLNERIGEFTYRINTYEDLWHLNQIVEAYNSKEIAPQVTIPNLIDAQADKRFNPGESAGLKLVCKFLNTMDADFKIFHTHNQEVVEALIDRASFIDNSGFIGRVLSEDFNSGHGIGGDYQDNIVLMSADAGGYKPLMKLCDKLAWKGETYSASKSRKFEDGKSKLDQVISQSDFGGKDVLIIDDICVYGGTFKGLANLLRERNCGKLYLAVSHMSIRYHENSELFKTFDHVFTTNSKFDDYWYKGKNGFIKPQNLTVKQLF